MISPDSTLPESLPPRREPRRSHSLVVIEARASLSGLTAPRRTGDSRSYPLLDRRANPANLNNPAIYIYLIHPRNSLTHPILTPRGLDVCTYHTRVHHVHARAMSSWHWPLRANTITTYETNDYSRVTKLIHDSTLLSRASHDDAR